MCKQCDAKQTIGRKFKNPQVWEPTKTCKVCKEVKPKDEFYSNRRVKKDGTPFFARDAKCRACKATEFRTKYEEDVVFRAREMVLGTKRRADKKGIAHDLTIEWLSERLERGVCEVTGLALRLDGGKLQGGHRSFTASLDRTDNTKGYTMDNVKVVCWIYNSAKGVGTHEDVMKLVEALSNVK